MPGDWYFQENGLGVRKLCLGPYDNNVYVVACRRTGKAVIIDAAAEPERILEETADVAPLAILTTHGHHDHVQAVDEVTAALSIPFRIHPADSELAGREPDVPLVDAETIRVGELALRTIHTPGHTPGSTCFAIAGHLFSGDTLFPGGPGATRFEYSSFPQIIESIEQRLFPLGADTVVHPGHGLDTTIGAEQSALPDWVARGW